MRMSGPNGDPNVAPGNTPVEEEEDFNDEEYLAIDSMLDEISSCLDQLEERNDSLNSNLLQLLESNRQARREFQAQLGAGEPEEHPPASSSSSPSPSASSH